MKHIKYIAAFTIGCQLLTSCSDSFVEVDPKGTTLEDGYYKNQEEAFNGLVAVYDPLGWQYGYQSKTAGLNAASDDFFAGGGSATDISAFQVWDDYTITPEQGPQQEFWNKSFRGIYRANLLLDKLPNVLMPEAVKSRYVAEVKFLRAYYYFDLARLFESFPQPTAPLASDQIFSVEQEDRAAAYVIMEEDLLAAIPDLPATIDIVTEAGRATKAAGHALLGKIYLEQKKYALAAAQFEEVNGTPGQIGPFGHALLDNYADLWKRENIFNTESIFEIARNSTSSAGWDNYGDREGNVISTLVGPRDFSINKAKAEAAGLDFESINFNPGWSFNTPTPSLVEAFVKDGIYDPRYSSTIVNMDSLMEIGVVSYVPYHENTGYFLTKFAGKKQNSAASGEILLNWATNEYEIRLADTYLLEAEALLNGGGNTTRAQALLDAVRARVGLSSIPANMQSVMEERRLELAGEGHRWFDLVRTGMAPAVLGPLGYIEGKHDALPIPQGEIDFDGTPLVQDPAY